MTDIFPDLELPDQLHALMNLGIKSEEIEVSDQIEEGIEMQPQHGSELSPLTSKSTGDEHPLSLCSLCANPGDDLINMSGHSGLHKYFLEKIEFCLPTIEMKKTDTLTKKACQLCLAQLELCYQFLKAVAKANKKLRTFNKQKSDDESHVEEKVDITSTFFSGELPTMDRRVQRNVISSNLNNTDKDGRTNSSNNKQRKIDSSTLAFNPCRLASQADLGTSRSPPNDPLHLVEELSFDRDASDSEPHAPHVTQSGKTLNKPRKESMKDKNTDYLFSGKKAGKEKDRKKLYTEDKKMKKKSVSYDRNECRKKFVSKFEPEYHELCSYESSGEPCGRRDSGEVMDIEITSPKSEASSCSGLTWAEKNKFACAHCNRKFKSKSVLTVHIRNHARERPHGCDFCTKAFQYASERDRHRRIHTGERPYSCEVCGKRFMSVGDTNRHRLSHNSEQPHSCDFCGKTFPYASERDRHRMVHTGERPYSCDLCSKTFRCTRDINRHKLRHTIERPYSCDFCSKTFLTTSSRRGHQRIHTGERPFRCSICYSSFYIQSALDNHLMRHLKENCNKVRNPVRSSQPGKYLCAHCEFTSKSKTDLVIHIRTHTGERPYRCDFCPKTFTRATNRNRHHRTHTGERPFECSICKKTFAEARSRDVHAFKHIIMNNDDGAIDFYGTSCNSVGQSEETKEENSSQPNFAWNEWGTVLHLNDEIENNSS